MIVSVNIKPSFFIQKQHTQKSYSSNPIAKPSRDNVEDFAFSDYLIRNQTLTTKKFNRIKSKLNDKNENKIESSLQVFNTLENSFSNFLEQNERNQQVSAFPKKSLQIKFYSEKKNITSKQQNLSHEQTPRDLITNRRFQKDLLYNARAPTTSVRYSNLNNESFFQSAHDDRQSYEKKHQSQRRSLDYTNLCRNQTALRNRTNDKIRLTSAYKVKSIVLEKNPKQNLLFQDANNNKRKFIDEELNSLDKKSPIQVKSKSQKLKINERIFMESICPRNSVSREATNYTRRKKRALQPHNESKEQNKKDKIDLKKDYQIEPWIKSSYVNDFEFSGIDIPLFQNISSNSNIRPKKIVKKSSSKR